MQRRADQRKFHYIYKITRDDSKFYIGMHSTDNMEDGYFGSGQRISRSIKKHGKERHVKEVLEFLPSREALKLREKELITEDMRANKLCMNIAPGGDGGFRSEQHEKNFRASQSRGGKIAGAKNGKIAGKKTGAANLRKIMSAWTQHNWQGLKHSTETREKMRRSKNVGSANSQFGTCWVTKDSKPIKIKKEQLDEYLATGYSQGRK